MLKTPRLAAGFFFEVKSPPSLAATRLNPIRILSETEQHETGVIHTSANHVLSHLPNAQSKIFRYKCAGSNN